MHELHFVSLGISVANILILSMLLYIYSKNYRHIKSKFNLGLMVFSLLFLVENLSSIAMETLVWSTETFDMFISGIAFINAIELLGLLTLLYITWK